MDVCIVFHGTKLSGNATKDRNGSIQIKIYNDKFQEHIVKYYMWEIFYLTYPTDKTKSWYFQESVQIPIGLRQRYHFRVKEQQVLNISL